MGLYHDILGTDWDRLHESVRQFHGDGQPVRASGLFRVRRGNWLARLIATLARLPVEGDNVPIQLDIEPDGEWEYWRRSFAGRPFHSAQRSFRGGLIAERAGLMELRFRLSVREGTLHYETEHVAVGLGPVRVPLPRWCSPRGDACETATDIPGQVRALIRVDLPLLGRLIVYEGVVNVEA